MNTPFALVALAQANRSQRAKLTFRANGPMFDLLPETAAGICSPFAPWRPNRAHEARFFYGRAQWEAARPADSKVSVCKPAVARPPECSGSPGSLEPWSPIMGEHTVSALPPAHADRSSRVLRDAALTNPAIRQALEDYVERLIAALDALDGDEDIEPDADDEPWLSGTPVEGGDDREWDFADLEPSPGWISTESGGIAFYGTEDLEREDERA